MKDRVIENSNLKIFIISFISMLIITLPNIIQNNGIFMFMGDYTLQQIPFYYHAADTVQNLGIGWDWYTNLGTDYLVSYGFYLLGSVFFWSISWLSGMCIVYAMPALIAIKTAVGATGAMAYIKRYVKNDTAAFIGAFMYAFSGFQMVSLVYNHFHDVTALFPYLLLSFDLLVKENKRCFFSFMVAISALTNYFFFVGTVVFVIIYYIIRCIRKDFIFSLNNFLLIVIESVIGVACSAIILIPTVIGLSSAERVTSILHGIDLITYSDSSIIPKIIQEMFMIPDVPSKASLFLSDDNTHNWASNSLYLPVFAMTGVFVYVKNNSKSWMTILLKVCFLFALISGLNSIFSIFNESYYARWFYMPVLIMCTATAKSIDEKYDFQFGIKIQGIALAVIAVISFLPDYVQPDALSLESDENPEAVLKLAGINKMPVVFWQYIAFAVIFLLIVFAYNHEKNKNQEIIKKIAGITVLLTTVTNIIFINNAVSYTGYDDEFYYDSIIEYIPEIEDDDVFRISHVSTNSEDNTSFMWGYMNAGGFHSIEPSQTDDFYYAIQGKRRWMTSKYGEDDFPVYGLLSVKYLFNVSTNDDLNVELDRVDVPGFSLYDEQEWFYIYKNEYYVPFGYMYDYCIDGEVLEKYLNDNITDNKYQYKKLAMMRSLVMSAEDIEKYSDYIKPIPDDMLESLDEESYYLDCNDRKSEACSYFEYDSKGFRAEITSDKSGLVYFSVPCSAGWTARINGRETDIIKVHYGLTAVPVESGDSIIEFSYETPGLRTGIIISSVSLGILLLYAAITYLTNKNRKNGD